MKFLKEFKIFEAEESITQPVRPKRFASKEEQRAFYKAKADATPVEDRIMSIEELPKFDIPNEIIEMMKSWDVIVKSPHGSSFYNSKEISWSYKPDGIYRVSDHWNFTTRGSKHCKTDISVKDNSHETIAQYDRASGVYKVILSLPKPGYVKLQNLSAKKKDFLSSPGVIAQKKEFKDKINNKEVIAQIDDHTGKTYKGIIRKYSGGELKIEDENGELIYNNNYLDKGDVVIVFDKEGNRIPNPYT